VWRDAAARVEARLLSFGIADDADVRGSVLGRTVDGSEIDLRIAGRSLHVRVHAPGIAMARNALAAAAAAHAAGAAPEAIVRGLAQFRPVRGRLAALATSSGATIVDDTYNANPDSVREGIDVLAHAGGRRWLVLGDMGEVGALGRAYHREIGEYARIAGIDRLLATGPLAREAVLAFGAHAAHYDDLDTLLAALAPPLPADVTLLVKGSRFMRMERVVAALAGGIAEGH
jgi:UDP-N-acetylmuramoyl-tripeptide--D-alanyl-D-alanine ligase